MDSYTGSAATNYLNVYKVAQGSSSAILMYGSLVVPGAAFGAPGGNGGGPSFHNLLP